MTLKNKLDINKLEKIYDRDNNREITPLHPEWERYKQLVLDTQYFKNNLKQNYNEIGKIKNNIDENFYSKADETNSDNFLKVISVSAIEIRKKKNSVRIMGYKQKTYERNKEIRDMCKHLYDFATYIDKNGREWRQYQHFRGEKTVRDLPMREIYCTIAEYYDMSPDSIKDINTKKNKI